MPTQYWGPWLAKIRRGGPDYYALFIQAARKKTLQDKNWRALFGGNKSQQV